MDKIKQLRGVIIAILIMLVFAFYWFEWRPSQIRRECFKEAEINSKLAMQTKADLDINFKKFADKGLYFKDDFEQCYKNCLRKQGLER